MTLRAGNPFYFLFSSADQALIDTSTIIVSDVAYAANPQVSDPYPQSLRIQFSLTTTGKAPKLRPLGPGLLTFHADPAPGKTVPTPAQAVAANYANWPTLGRLRLTISDPQVLLRLTAITGLPVVPSDIWYSSVNLTQNFLFQSLPALPVTKVIGGKTVTVQPGTADALRQMVSGFLKGKFTAQLVSGSQASADSQSLVDMPELAPTAAGTFDFYITTGFTGKPFDGEEKDYENANSVTDDWEPAHPRNGIIPARLVYRSLRTHATGDIINAALGSAVPDAVLASSATAGVPDYYPIRFTRVWKPVEDRSVHFPSQVVRAEQITTATTFVIEQRLPAHGILFIAQTPIQKLASSDFRISLTNPSGKPEREMWWLTGGVPNVWQDAAANTPITVTLPPANQALQAIPHVLLRRQMGQEVIYDRKGRPTHVGAACTYYSLRRIVRALVNNRISGGRLNFEVFIVGNRRQGRNTQVTRDLVSEALGAAAAGAVMDGKPDHTGQPGVEAPKLIPVLEALFPNIVPPQPGNEPDPGMTYGKAAYWIWQTGFLVFQDNATKRAFDDTWLGGGGSGALVELGLAADYAVNPGQTTVRVTNPPESDTSFRDRLVADMLAGRLEPGGVLQFWENFSDLTKIRTRTVPNAGTTGAGHSPIFLRYSGPAGNPTGMLVLDQTGERVCTRTGNAGASILPWDGFNPDSWIAANWFE